jgi:hypothetical protein
MTILVRSGRYGVMVYDPEKPSHRRWVGTYDTLEEAERVELRETPVRPLPPPRAVVTDRRVADELRRLRKDVKKLAAENASLRQQLERVHRLVLARCHDPRPRRSCLPRAALAFP